MTSPLGRHVAAEIGSDGTVVVQTFDAPIVAGISVDGMAHIRSQRDLDEDYRLETGPGRLELRPREGRWPFGWRRDRTPLTVDVPAGATVRFDSTSGGVTVTGLSGEQHYRTASGEVAADIDGGDVTIESASGSASLTARRPTVARARTASGDIRILADHLTSLEVRSMSGRVEVVGRPEGEGPFGIETVSGSASLGLTGPAQVDATSVSGVLRSELPSRGSGGVGLRTMVVDGAGPLVRFRSVSGGLRVEDRAGRGAGSTTAGPGAETAAPATSGDTSMAAGDRDARLDILRALERGEIDVADADRRLAAVGSSERPAGGAVVGGEPRRFESLGFYGRV